MHFLVLPLGLVFLFLIVVFAPWPRRLFSSVARSPSRLSPGRFDVLLSYIEDGTPAAAQDFWRASAGNSGILSRLADMTALVHVLQSHVASGIVDRDDASYVYWLAMAQGWVSIIALCESALCRVIPALPHAVARLALQIHWQLTLRTMNLVLDSSISESRRLFL